MRRVLLVPIAALVLAASAPRAEVTIQAYALPSGGGFPHDVAVGPDGIAWYTAQRSGLLGRLDPATGKVDLIPLGPGAAPHGVIIGPDHAPWITEGGTNAIVRFHPETETFEAFPSDRRGANVRQILGRPGEVWVPESGADRLVVFRVK